MPEQLELRVDAYSAYDRAEHAEQARRCQGRVEECDRIGFLSGMYTELAEYHRRKAQG